MRIPAVFRRIIKPGLWEKSAFGTHVPVTSFPCRMFDPKSEKIDEIDGHDYVMVPIELVFKGGSSDGKWDELKKSKAKDRQFDALVKSIKENGFLTPLLLDITYDGVTKMSNGHHRLIAAWTLGYTHVPMTIQGSWNDTQLSRAQEMALGYSG